MSGTLWFTTLGIIYLVLLFTLAVSVATAMLFGVGPAMVTALLAACVHAARRRPSYYKAVFNTASFTLATGAAAGLYVVLDGAHASGPVRILLRP